MMKLMPTWLVGLVLLSACSGLRVINPPKSIMSDFQLTSITPDSLFFQGQLKLKNNNPLTLTIKKVKLMVEINQKLKVTRAYEQLPDVLSFDVKQVDLPVKIKRAMLNGQHGPLEIHCQAWVLTQNKEFQEPLELDYETTLEMPAAPAMTAGQLMINKSKDKLAQEINFSNSNAYPLILSRILGHVEFDRFDYVVRNIKAPLVIPPQQTRSVRLIAEKRSRIPSVQQVLPQIDFTFSAASTKMVIPYEGQAVSAD